MTAFTNHNSTSNPILIENNSSQKNGDVSIPFRPVQMEVKQLFHAQKSKQDGAEIGNERAVNYSF